MPKGSKRFVPSTASKPAESALRTSLQYSDRQDRVGESLTLPEWSARASLSDHIRSLLSEGF
jgi:hypothetical protein